MALQTPHHTSELNAPIGLNVMLCMVSLLSMDGLEFLLSRGLRSLCFLSFLYLIIIL